MRGHRNVSSDTDERTSISTVVVIVTGFCGIGIERFGFDFGTPQPLSMFDTYAGHMLWEVFGSLDT